MAEEELAWAFQHSVNCNVEAELAWNFWTNVAHWKLDSDVESVEINGPFAVGTRGSTKSKSAGCIEWRIAEAAPGRAVIEFPLAGAVGRCVWTFEDMAGCTKITQRWTLQGDRAGEYAKTVAPSLEAGIPAGMRKLCERMEEAAQLDQPSRTAR